MRLTRRGYGAVGIAGLAVVLATLFGPRSLNAVAAPLLAAVALGAVQVWRADAPTVDPARLAPGFPGESRTWSLAVDGSGVVAYETAWPTGLEGETREAVVTLPATIEAELTLAARGIYEVTLPPLRRRDALGLVEATVEVDAATPVVVYPRVRQVAERGALAGVFADEAPAERQEFDSLREYRPGDPLRAVHWKSSAKYDDFLVKEFDPSRRTETLVIAASATPGCADAMAEAAASLALLGLEAGLSVGLRLPGETLAPGAGEAHAANLLRALARAGHGEHSAGAREEADIAVEAHPPETLIRVGDRTLLFGELSAEPDRAEVAVA